MSDDRDWQTFDYVPKPRHIPKLPAERLWTLRKDEHVATADERPHPRGTEIIIYAKGELVWSASSTLVNRSDLLTRAEQTRRDFLDRGWA